MSIPLYSPLQITCFSSTPPRALDAPLNFYILFLSSFLFLFYYFDYTNGNNYISGG